MTSQQNPWILRLLAMVLLSVGGVSMSETSDPHHPGIHATLRCSVPPSVGGKVPHVRWVRIGRAGAETLYDSENAGGEEEFSIVAHNLTSEHSGEYSCLVSDDHNQERSLSVRLLVGERRLSGNRFHPSVKDISPYCFTGFPESCPKPRFENWYKVESYCIKYFSNPMTFDGAESHCQQQVSDGHLVAIQTSDAEQKIKCLIERDHFSDSTSWLGGMVLGESRKFIWTDGSKWQYTDWAQGEPNNYGGHENCLELNLDRGPTGKWNDLMCSIRKPFVCAFKL